MCVSILPESILKVIEWTACKIVTDYTDKLDRLINDISLICKTMQETLVRNGKPDSGRDSSFKLIFLVCLSYSYLAKKTSSSNLRKIKKIDSKFDLYQAEAKNLI